MACGQNRELLSAYHDGVLAGDERSAVGDHIEQCPDCRAVLEDYRAMGQAFRALPRVKASPAVLKGVREGLAGAPASVIPFRHTAVLSFALATAAALLIGINLVVYLVGPGPTEPAGIAMADDPVEPAEPESSVWNAGKQPGAFGAEGVDDKAQKVEKDFADEVAPGNVKPLMPPRLAAAGEPKSDQEPKRPSAELKFLAGAQKDAPRELFLVQTERRDLNAPRIEAYLGRLVADGYLAKQADEKKSETRSNAKMRARGFATDALRQTYTVELTEAGLAELRRVASETYGMTSLEPGDEQLKEYEKSGALDKLMSELNEAGQGGARAIPPKPESVPEAVKKDDQKTARRLRAAHAAPATEEDGEDSAALGKKVKKQVEEQERMRRSTAKSKGAYGKAPPAAGKAAAQTSAGRLAPPQARLFRVTIHVLRPKIQPAPEQKENP